VLDPHAFLRDLALVLGIAALTTVLFQRLRQPVVLGYLLAGLILGPHLRVPLVADLGTVQTLSELGVILLMFSIGLEFSVRRLVQLGPGAAFVTAVEVGLMFWLGFSVGRLLDWSLAESLFAGGIIAISSTMIVARAFAEAPQDRELMDLVFAILVVEDLIAVLLIAMLTPVAGGDSLSGAELVTELGRLLLFLAVIVAAGLLTIPRMLRFVVASASRETTLVAAVGLAFALALLARSFGYSVALGAFVAGSLASESGHARILELLIRPLRDVFAAIFFVSVGMLIDPMIIVRNAPLVALFTVLVIAGKITGVSLGAFLTGRGARTSIRAGMSMAQIGEFSFILAGVGLSLGGAGSVLYPVAVAVSALTAFTTPYLVRVSGRAVQRLDRSLPPSFQTFETLYGTWIERLRERRRSVPGALRVALLMLADAAILVGVVIAASLSLRDVSGLLVERLGLAPELATTIVVATTALACVPFAAGIARAARRLARLLASEALPHAVQGRADLAAAPRRALVTGLQLAILFTVGMPVLALTQPFLPSLPTVAVLTAAAILLGAGLWRSVSDLEGHVRAGAQVIVEVLARQSRAAEPPALDEVGELLPGLEDVTPVRVEWADDAVGRSLEELDLHGRSGAKVVCITRGAEGMVQPQGAECLRAGDVVALAGTKEELSSARSILAAGKAPQERERDEVA
jgi:CPA2 family monovalent cation:H+ antiporter-2